MSIRTHIHFGIIEMPKVPGSLFIRVDDDARRYPSGNWTSNGDSFLVWGESAEKEADGTLHVIYMTDEIPSRTRFMVPVLRAELLRSGTLFTGERLADYAVATDAEDWAEDQYVWTLDGTMSKSGQPV